MEKEPTTCTGCGRAMWTADVDGDGNCPDCAKAEDKHEPVVPAQHHDEE